MGRKGVVIRVDGEVLAKIDERVDTVQILAARGEIGRIGIAEADEVIDIVVHRAGVRNKHLLDVEAEQRALARDEALEREGEIGPEGGGQLSGIGSSPDEDIEVRAPNPLEAKADVRAEQREEEGNDTDKSEGDEGFPKS